MKSLLSKIAVFSLLLGCATLGSAAPGKRTPVKPAVSPLAKPRVLEPEVVWNEVRLPSPAGFMRLWIYRPAEAQLVSTKKYPVVFIAPAGTPLHFGMRTGPGDVREHLPYVRAGFIVVNYDIDGAVPENYSDAESLAGTRAFMRANAGIFNGKAAIDFALKSIPGVDPKRLYVAGHSSAGTLALQMAQNDSRIAACVAYAPACDLVARLTPEGIANMNQFLPGYQDFIVSVSPSHHPERLRCPLFLFHAEDDTNVPTIDNYTFAALNYRTNKRVVFARVAKGGHFDAMANQGIPWAIRWLQTSPEKTPPTTPAKKR